MGWFLLLVERYLSCLNDNLLFLSPVYYFLSIDSPPLSLPYYFISLLILLSP